jgi:hypothetical protein
MISGDSVESEEELRIKFCSWLIENGAKFPKILWPSIDTESEFFLVHTCGFIL